MNKRLPAVFALTVLAFSCTSQNRPALLVSGSGPLYPIEAKVQGIEGSVTLRYDIESDGSVSNLVVVSSQPATLFDEAALTAVSRWRFNPRIVDGRDVTSRRQQSIVSFRLEGAERYDEY
ncbi:MAG: energy transducer TonB [Pseudomonadales bacterium]|nr:energy transducer TonB [Pseudomonadales bacterium]